MAAAETFERFAATEARGSSPLYEALSEGVADDGAMLALADEIPADQPAPNLLFAAVQYHGRWIEWLAGARHPRGDIVSTSRTG